MTSLTLRRCWGEVSELLKNLSDKKVVITSDHGEAFGEWGIYGHPGGVYIKALTEVPWFECNTKSLKERGTKLNKKKIKIAVKKIVKESNL